MLVAGSFSFFLLVIGDIVQCVHVMNSRGNTKSYVKEEKMGSDTSGILSLWADSLGGLFSLHFSREQRNSQRLEQKSTFARVFKSPQMYKPSVISSHPDPVLVYCICESATNPVTFSHYDNQISVPVSLVAQYHINWVKKSPSKGESPTCFWYSTYFINSQI